MKKKYLAIFEKTKNILIFSPESLKTQVLKSLIDLLRVSHVVQLHLSHRDKYPFYKILQITVAALFQAKMVARYDVTKLRVLVLYLSIL